MKLSADEPSMEYYGLRTSSAWLPGAAVPAPDQLRAAADVLDGGKRVAVLVGQGAVGARAEGYRAGRAVGCAGCQGASGSGGAGR